MACDYRIEAFGRTDAGHVRCHNEDQVGCFPELGLFLVADGMGGQRTGDRASELVVSAMREAFGGEAAPAGGAPPPSPYRDRPDPEKRLAGAVKLANRRVWELSERDVRYRGLGSTVAAVSAAGGRAQIAHVGDSRVYRLRGGALEALTRDHSLLNDYLRLKPDLTPEELAAVPRNVLTRALGLRDDVVVDTRSLPLDGGDVLLICTDGVHALVPDRQIAAILLEHPAPEAAADRLIEAALRNGGDDNATCVVLRVTES